MNGVLLNVVVEKFEEVEVNHEIVGRPTLDTNCEQPSSNLKSRACTITTKPCGSGACPPQ